ncbi:MAG TPA: class III extradiol ring-cleavage dioxygenase [Leptolyngbyaceae cyanobacterium]
MQNIMPVIFVGHGATIFTMNSQDPTHVRFQEIGRELKANPPQAILCVSAHFIESKFIVTAAQKPPTIHDHPVQDLYSWKYPAPGHPELALRICNRLNSVGLQSSTDPRRGIDHGAWIPASLMFPEARIPVLQVSLHQSYDLNLHFRLGQALEVLRHEGVLIICSGGVTHNQQEFRRGYFSGADVNVPANWSKEFDDWVSDLLTVKSPQHWKELLNFQYHHLSDISHPTIEHFLPMLVAIGAGDRDNLGAAQAVKLHTGFQHSLSTSAFLFNYLHN